MSPLGDEPFLVKVPAKHAWRRWQRLHRLVYFIAAGGVLHYLWLVKSDIREPVLSGLILMALLGYRLWGSLLRVPAR